MFSNSPLFVDQSVMEFFETSRRNLLAAGKLASVRHHVVMSVVPTNWPQKSGYFRARLVQEELVKKSGLPYSLVRSTQFYEFLDTLADSGDESHAIQLSPVAF